ncbi:MAG: hypothetical protein ACK52J_03280 [bacterium]|jgi:hypothetical protein
MFKRLGFGINLLIFNAGGVSPIRSMITTFPKKFDTILVLALY